MELPKQRGQSGLEKSTLGAMLCMPRIVPLHDQWHPPSGIMTPPSEGAEVDGYTPVHRVE